MEFLCWAKGYVDLLRARIRLPVPGEVPKLGDPPAFKSGDLFADRRQCPHTFCLLQLARVPASQCEPTHICAAKISPRLVEMTAG